MALDFKLSDFCYPSSLLRLKRQFSKSQYWSFDALEKYQFSKLKLVLNHAYTHVPYYRKVFDALALLPSDIKTVHDLNLLPLLTKDKLRHHFEDLKSDDYKKRCAKLLTTSGTSGFQTNVLMDKSANVLEFVYYWHYWGWAGYQLGNRVAEFTSVYFMKRPALKMNDFSLQRFTNRILLNNIYLDETRLNNIIRLLRKFKPLFLKGLPSTLCYFAEYLNQKSIKDIHFKGIFTTGEILHPYQRTLLSNCFHAKCFDSYGLTERVAAICECEYGSQHIIPEYGLIELLPTNDFSEGRLDGMNFKRIVATSLHNFSMPLIRYDTGDLVETSNNPSKCTCNRNYKIVRRILGRSSNILKLSNGRFIPNLHVIFDDINGLNAVKVVQHKSNHILISLRVNQAYENSSNVKIKQMAKEFVGSDCEVSVDVCVGLKASNQFQSKSDMVTPL